MPVICRALGLWGRHVRLSDSDTVDYLSAEKRTGALRLTLLDDFEGDDLPRRLALLQRKINRYFDFIESGEVFEHRERTTGERVPRDTPIRIDVIAKQGLHGEGERFLSHASGAAQEAGVEFSFRVVKPE